MALQQVVDKALSLFIARAQPVLKPFALSLKRYLFYYGILVGLPLYLFLLLVSSSVFHWWRFPWSLQVTRWLFAVTALCAVVDALFYGAASLVFFLTWWRKKLRVSDQKRPDMAFSYIFTPFIYGLIAAWGVTSLREYVENQLAGAALITFVLLSLSRITLGFLKGFVRAK